MDRPPDDCQDVERWLAWHDFKVNSKKDCWEKPRYAIAHPFQHNDIGYCAGGVKMAAKVILGLTENGLSVKDMANKRLLEYGCGTGRVTRALAFFFKQSIGYDPYKQCISAARKETEKCDRLYLPGQLEFVEHIAMSNLRFDVIAAVDSLTVVDRYNLGAACKVIESLLAPSGLVVANFYNYQRGKVDGCWGKLKYLGHVSPSGHAISDSAMRVYLNE